MTKVMCFGSFDFFHEGHKYFLRECAKNGDILYIVLATDKNIEMAKGEKPMFDIRERMSHIYKVFPEAILIEGNETDFYMPIREIKPDIVCLGHDQDADINRIKNEFPNIKIIRIEAHERERYKSSLLKKEQKK